MAERPMTAVRTDTASAVEFNKVLRNTYMLLSATLGFSALTAMISMAIGMPPIAYLGSVIVAMVWASSCCRAPPTPARVSGLSS